MYGVILFLLAFYFHSIGQAQPWQRSFGVVNITPNEQSGETNQNSEPSIAVGTGNDTGHLIVHTFNLTQAGPPAGLIFTTVDGGHTWTNTQTLNTPGDYDATIAYASLSSWYMAMMPWADNLQVWFSSVPFGGQPFHTGGAGVIGGNPDQPWLKVLNVDNADHIYVGFNDLEQINSGSPATASVEFSLDGTQSWKRTVIEKAVPGGGQDSPAVRLAISENPAFFGKTVYALFQRWQSFDMDTFDFRGDVVLVRDDNSGLNGFGDLPNNGTLVAQNILFPVTDQFGRGTSLGMQRLGAGCDVASIPSFDGQDEVYVAYTEVVSNSPLIRVQHSSDSGRTFQLVYSTSVASSLPALAIASDHTVGLLFAAKVANNLEVHFLKAYDGRFNQVKSLNERVLAQFPDNNPNIVYNPYIGDYFGLTASGHDFYGTFCASGAPDPSHFPSGVYYQRNVTANGAITNDVWLTSPGALADLSRHLLAPSIDPFFFYDLAPRFLALHEIAFFWRRPSTADPTAALVLTWPVLSSGYPQFTLETASALGPTASWTPVPTSLIVQSNGDFQAALSSSQSQQYFRLNQQAASGYFQLLAATGDHGSLSPGGTLLVGGTQNQTFTATPSNNYAVGNWYVDGGFVQSNNSTLTLSNITVDHSVLVTFAASNDLAVTLAGAPHPALLTNNLTYVINVQNTGLNPVTGVTLSNVLPPSVSFVSATASQGSVTGLGTSSLVTGSLGTLAPGLSATVTITTIPYAEGAITDTVAVACDQFEPDLANNIATDITSVLAPVTITAQPVSQSASAGDTVSFSVGVSGTPPFLYRWAFNGVAIAGATNALLTLTNVVAASAGAYAVTVFQTPGPEDEFEADGQPASLTVFTPGSAQTTAGTALSFNGTNQYVSFPDVTHALAQGTIELWFNASSWNWTAAYDGLYLWAGTQGAPNTSAGDGIDLGTHHAYSTTGELMFGIFEYGSFNNWHWARSGVVPSPGAWYHVAATWGTAGLQIYVNGVLGGTDPYSGPAPAYTIASLLGCSSWPGSFFNGQIDELRIWNVARTQSQIQANMNHGLSLPAANLVAYWRFDEAGGTTAFDSSGLGRDGTLGNGPAWVTSTVPFGPGATTQPATSVGSGLATLNATVTPNAATANVWFDWGTTTSYGASTSAINLPAGTSSVVFSRTLTALASGATYHYRVNAANALGTSTGADAQFTMP